MESLRSESESKRSQPGTREPELAALRNLLDETARPQLNTPIVDLDPGNVTRSAAQQISTAIDLPVGTRFFTLVLHISGDKSHSGYALEILDRSERIWLEEGLVRSPENTFTLTLPTALIRRGDYRLRLYGLSRVSRELLEVYTIAIH